MSCGFFRDIIETFLLTLLYSRPNDEECAPTRMEHLISLLSMTSISLLGLVGNTEQCCSSAHRDNFHIGFSHTEAHGQTFMFCADVPPTVSTMMTDAYCEVKTTNLYSGTSQQKWSCSFQVGAGLHIPTARMGRDLEIHWEGQNWDEDWAMQGGIIYLYLQICNSQVFNQKVPVLLWKTQKNKVRPYKKSKHADLCTSHYVNLEVTDEGQWWWTINDKSRSVINHHKRTWAVNKSTARGPATIFSQAVSHLTTVCLLTKNLSIYQVPASAIRKATTMTKALCVCVCVSWHANKYSWISPPMCAGSKYHLPHQSGNTLQSFSSGSSIWCGTNAESSPAECLVEQPSWKQHFSFETTLLTRGVSLEYTPTCSQCLQEGLLRSHLFSASSLCWLVNVHMDGSFVRLYNDLHRHFHRFTYPTSASTTVWHTEADQYVGYLSNPARSDTQEHLTTKYRKSLKILLIVHWMTSALIFSLIVQLLQCNHHRTKDKQSRHSVNSSCIWLQWIPELSLL